MAAISNLFFFFFHGIKSLQVEMEILKHRLEEESRARATADSRILEVRLA